MSSSNKKQIKLLKELTKVSDKYEVRMEQLTIAIVGLKAIISEGSDNLNIAEKTIEEIKKVSISD